MAKETFGGITYGEEYCLNCKRKVTAKSRSLGLVFLGVLLFIPAFIFMFGWLGGSSWMGYLSLPLFLVSFGIAYYGEEKRCPICNSKNWRSGK